MRESTQLLCSYSQFSDWLIHFHELDSMFLQKGYPGSFTLHDILTIGSKVMEPVLRGFSRENEARKNVRLANKGGISSMLDDDNKGRNNPPYFSSSKVLKNLRRDLRPLNLILLFIIVTYV